jgi:hypothetical protein
MDYEYVKVIEVRPGDPPDLDDLLEQVDRILEHLRGANTLVRNDCQMAIDLRAARHGEGGDQC